MSTSEQELKISPMMAQWQACKEAAADALLLFRLGDFYEAFHQDAVLISRELDLTLTKRQDIPMCGVPHHTTEGYIDKLISKGYKVAIAEQVGDPTNGKGLMHREVIRVVTPGTLISSALLCDKGNNYFAAICKLGALFGLAYMDLTTAEFRAAEFEKEADLLNELARLKAAEILCSKRFIEKQGALIAELRLTNDCMITSYEEWRFEHQYAYNALKNHFNVATLDSFGLKGMTAAINAAGALINYTRELLSAPLNHISTITPYTTAGFMVLDRMTQRNLELVEGLLDGSRKTTLLAVLDKTATPMGGRLIRQWIKQPLLNINDIAARQTAVELLVKNSSLIGHLKNYLETVRDLERLMMRISTGYGSPRDIAALGASLKNVAPIQSALCSCAPSSTLLTATSNSLDPLPELVETIAKALVDEPPARFNDGNIFREGHNSELDELKELSLNSRAWLQRYQENLRASTGVKTLKVGYTKMFGYYIEVSRGQAEKMGGAFTRRQTLVNGERFITQELKDFENKMTDAEERIAALEADLFQKLRTAVMSYAKRVFVTAQGLAILDVLQSFATAAKEYNYSKPVVDDSSLLHIVEGRHPVIEVFQGRERFIPNDTLINDNNQSLLVITGPNMAGKSTYIRQVALIVIMAQIGSFIPAKSGHIGVVDKVFTRIGASDDLARGQSTFMVEMTETANILHNATSRSLVVLDEIGRGTSTYDGISIAWSVAEYLLSTDGKRAKTLFATHYWELTKLEEKIKGAINYNIAVNSSNDSITFLRKIMPGPAPESYGINVGKIAGLPAEVISRAKEILAHLEENSKREHSFDASKLPKRKATPKKNSVVHELQLSFFG